MASIARPLCLSLGLCLAPALAQAQIVVEVIPDENVLRGAGVQPGDVFVSWERLPSPPENPNTAAGTLGTPFDWEWMTFEQAMRGTVRLTGEHLGQPATWTVPIGLLIDAEVRPVLPPEVLEPYQRGLDLLRQKRTADAADCWRWLAEELRRAGDRRRAGWLFLRVARTLTGLRVWDEAEKSYQAALAEARDPQSTVTILEAMGDSYAAAGRPMEAEECHLAELRIEHAAWGESLETALTDLKMGWLAADGGQLETAQTYLEQALAIEQRLAPKSGLLAETLKGLGNVILACGDLETAERYLRISLRMEQEMAPASYYVSTALSALGLLHYLRGDLDSAEDLFREGLEAENRMRPGTKYVATFLENLAGIAQDRNDIAAAEDFYVQTLSLAEKVYPGSMRYARKLEGLGRLAVTKGDLATAQTVYDRARQILERVAPEGLELAHVLKDLGALEATGGTLEKAEEYARKSLAISQRLAPGSLQRAETLHLLSSILLTKGSTTQAEKELTGALEILEAQIGQLGGSLEVKGAFRAEAGDIYRDAIRLQTERGHSGEAFRLLERFRAQSFLALLATRDLTFAADISPSLDRERRRVTALYDRNELRLAAFNLDQEETEALRREQIRLREQREEIDAEIHQASPRLAAMIHPRTLTFEAVRAALDPGTVMLSYSVGKKQTQLFVVAPGRELEVKTLPVGEEALRRDVESLRQLIDQARSKGSLGVEGLDWTSRRLYRLLIQPAETSIAAGDRIVIVPDGPLHRLPFAALIRKRAPGKKSERSWQYLVEWRPLHTVLSGSVYAELKERRRTTESGAAPFQWVAFGDPWFPPQLAQGRPLESGEARLRSFSTRTGLQWERLPESRREVEKIAQLFPAASRQIYLDREATEEHAKALGRQTRIVHFATHGFVDDHSPFDSGLVLAIPEHFTEGTDNGLLQVWEIFENVRLDADLVVLSACETGLGEIRGGEGIIGLTRAFQYAGARSVLASLWRVDDKATADLMERFYRHLRAGQPKAEALRSAQLELLRGEGKDAAAPFFWAALQLFGDWQ